MSWRRLHRWCAIVLAVPLLIWSITALVFFLKPGWSRAYDQLDCARPGAKLKATGFPHLPEFERMEMFDSSIGVLARLQTAKGTVLVDSSGVTRSPLTVDEATTLARDAVAHSPHHDAYGEPAESSVTDTTVTLRMSGGPIVEIDRASAQISQRGPDTDRIDWLYRVHYLQWTRNKTIDRILGIVGLALIWAVIIPGVVLFVRKPGK